MLITNFSPFPLLFTEQLLLRQLTIDDANEIFILRSDERILAFIDIPKANNLEDAIAFINKINTAILNNDSIYWGIQFKNKAPLIGTICLWNISREEERAEIGYVLHPDFQGKGIMQEALMQVIEYGFNNLKLQTIVADVDPQNLKSIQLLKRNGFVYETEITDTAIYVLKKSYRKADLK